MDCERQIASSGPALLISFSEGISIASSKRVFGESTRGILPLSTQSALGLKLSRRRSTDNDDLAGTKAVQTQNGEECRLSKRYGTSVKSLYR